MSLEAANDRYGHLDIVKETMSRQFNSNSHQRNPSRYRPFFKPVIPFSYKRHSEHCVASQDLHVLQDVWSFLPIESGDDCTTTIGGISWAKLDAYLRELRKCPTEAFKRKLGFGGKECNYYLC